MNPGPLTPRKLFWMADGLQRDAWLHTSWLLSQIWNVHRMSKDDPVREPSDYYPFSETKTKKARVPFKQQAAALRLQFVGKTG